MVSVTSDVTAGGSYQPAPKSTRPDPSQSSGDFAALVDSNTPTDLASALAPAPEPRAAPQPSDDSPPANSAPPADNARPADNAQPRDNAGADADRTPPAKSDDRATDPGRSNDDVADAKGSHDGPRHSAPKSGASKSGSVKTGDTKTADKLSSGSKVDQITSTPQDATAVITPDAIAIVLPANPPLTNTPATPSTDGNPNAPLAIASAAIAASAAVTAAAAPPAQTQTKTGLGNGETSPENGTAVAKPAAASGKQAAAETASTDATVETTLGTSTPVTAKPMPPQTAVPPLTKVSSSPKMPGGKDSIKDGAKDAAGTPDQSAAVPKGQPGNAAPQPAAAAKPDSSALADAAKADGADKAVPAPATVLPHDRASTASNAPLSLTPVDPGPQAAVLTQPQFSVPLAVPGNVSVTAATGAPVPVSGLALEIAASVQSGKTRFEVRLDPADLGRIDVRIDVDRNGQVTSHLTVEKPETLSMLRQDAPQLQQALNDAGLKTNNGSLQFSLRDQSSSGQQNNNQSGGNAHRLVINQEDNQAAAVAGQSYGRMLGAGGGVDIRV